MGVSPFVGFASLLNMKKGMNIRISNVFVGIWIINKICFSETFYFCLLESILVLGSPYLEKGIIKCDAFYQSNYTPTEIIKRKTKAPEKINARIIFLLAL